MQTDPAATPTKTCRYCAETDLADDAIVCKHCGKDVGPGSGLREAGEKMPAVGLRPDAADYRADSADAAVRVRLLKDDGDTPAGVSRS